MRNRASGSWPLAFWALLLVAAALRFGYVVGYPQLPVSVNAAALADYALYDEVGRNLADGKGFVGGFAAATYDAKAMADPRAPEIGVGPIYPAFLGGIYRLAGHRVGVVRVVQAAVSLLLLVPLFAITRWTFGDRAALVATALASVYPAFIIYSGLLLTETLSATLLVAALWAVLWAWRSAVAWRWALAGFIMGVVVLLRSEVLPVAVIAAAVSFWRRPAGPTVRMLALYAAVICATMAPWVVRNYYVFHRVIPVSAHDGDTLWITVKGWTEWHFDDAELQALVRGRSYLEQQDAFHAAAVREILNHPMHVAMTRLRRFPDFWLSGHTGYVAGFHERFADYRARGAAWPSFVKASLLTMNTALIVAGLIGIARAFTRPGPPLPGALLIAAPIVCIATVHLILFAAPRYQVPMMPFMLVFAGSLWQGPARIE